MELYNGQKTDATIRFVWEEDGPGGKFLATRTGEGGTLTVGLGKKEEITAQKLRRAAAAGVGFAKKLDAASAAVDFAPARPLGEAGAAALAEGAMLATFEAESWKQDKEPRPFALYAMEYDGGDNLLQHTGALVESVFFARQLVNRPANLLTPVLMAEEMQAAARQVGVEAEVLDEAQIRALGMEAFLTVGTSSGNPPRLIVLRYAGAPESDERIALVGKGIACDTGGYCLKPAGSLKGMRGDMAGAAACCGAVLAAAKNKLATNVVAVIPAAENRISPTSFLPGDVIGSMSGKTIEIGNSDAEGRLLLADAVTYAVRNEKATHVVDIATLTGAVVAAFGFTTAGALSNDDAFWARFEKAAARAGEQYWRLPAFDEYKKMIESPVADLSNTSSDGCGSITAGLFVGEFTEGKPWIHLDIAGTAWVDRPRWEYQSKLATGAGVASLYQLLANGG